MEKLEIIRTIITDSLEENKQLPCRIDEMTDREAVIANMVCDLYSTLKLVAQEIESFKEKEDESRS